MRHSRMLSLAGAVAIATGLAACGTADPYGPNNYPVSDINANPAGTAFVGPQSNTVYANAGQTYVVPGTTTYVAPGTAVAPAVEYGRVTNVQLLQPAARPSNGNALAGTVVGGVVGGLLGNTVGGGMGRAAATALGAVIGAGVGNNLASRPYNNYAQAIYRVWVQTDSGIVRTYDVAANADLHPGDRVRIDNGMIYQG